MIGDSMFLSREIIDVAFLGLKRIDVSLDGKKRQEMVSALRYFLAAAEVMNTLTANSIDLSVGNESRVKFSSAVGNVVSLGGGPKYSNNLFDGIKTSADFGVGSNFLTTVVKKSESNSRAYPSEQRNAPLLEISNWILKLHPDYINNLKSVYNLNSYIAELYIWLCRSLDFSTVINMESSAVPPSNKDIASAVILLVEKRYGSKIGGTVNNLISKVKAVLDSAKETVLVEEKYDFYDFLDSKKSMPKNKELLSDTNPILMKFKKLVAKGERNFLFFGAPGTGKTWYAEQIPLSFGRDTNQIKTLQFHPSISYDDFVEGYVSELNEKGQLYYTIKAKHFVQICEDARTNPSENYFMIIDEFSRGDPARVMGEMLTYIERSYRGREFQLIYSGRNFSVPENLIIIATANPLDRSVSELDDALLRRFSIFKFESDVEVLKSRLEKNGLSATDVQKVKHFFEIIEANMSIGFGHAHFFDVRSTDDLKELWDAKLSFIIQRNLEYENDAWETISSKFEELFNTDKQEAAAEAEV